MLNIVTWNINGIRSSHQDLKTLFDSLEADIICLQETKITRDMLDEATAVVDGYTSYYSFSRKKSGYSGVATYCKTPFTPFQAEEGIAGTFNSCNDRIEHYDNIHISFTDDELRELDAEGRCVMTLHRFKEEGSTDASESFKNLVVINVYCPNAGENDERLDYKLKFFRALSLRCNDMLKQGYRVIVLGDMNVSHRLIDHCEPEDVINFSKTPSRVWMDGFLVEGGGKFIDSFRYLYPTKEKSFTCWNTKLSARTNNYGTRIDYVLISSELRPALKDCVIMSNVLGSDHCPVKATISMDIIPSTKLPALCTKNFKEFSGKQLKMSTFMCKRSLTVESNQTLKLESEPKKAKLTLKTNKQQSNLLNFFTPKIVPYSQESEPSLNFKFASTSSEACEEFLEKTSAGTTNSSSTTASSVLWKNVLKGPPPPPVCNGHREPCVLRTVKKKGPNMNRQFWACSRAAGHSTDLNAQCNFFLWASTKR